MLIALFMKSIYMYSFNKVLMFPRNHIIYINIHMIVNLNAEGSEHIITTQQRDCNFSVVCYN